VRIAQHRPGQAVEPLVVPAHDDLEQRSLPLEHALDDRFIAHFYRRYQHDITLRD
jgi:hypothetical protein